ncbi:MAG: hypothetical protein H6737_07985 [Alphaproteobacteria bacterium]|nr:hypothetical protein [Alphaproteobacteria bacterium]
MNWRPYIVVLALVVALIVNAALIGNERIPDLEVREQVSLEDEPLRHMTYAPNTRMQNFTEMGMDDELAQRAANLAAGLQSNRQRYLKMLEDQAIDVGDAFCPSSSKLPQPYAAMRYLVVQEGGRRDVIDGHNSLFAFEEQAWFEKEGGAAPVYNTLERRAGRRQDATVMGVAAVLLGREQEAVTERGPWSTGFLGGGSFTTLESESAGIRQMTAEYFALMHYLTELANEQDGICR